MSVSTEYKSPEYEMLALDLVIQRLISIGYPPVSHYNTDVLGVAITVKYLIFQEIADIKYDPTFPLRYTGICVLAGMHKCW